MMQSEAAVALLLGFVPISLVALSKRYPRLGATVFAPGLAFSRSSIIAAGVYALAAGIALGLAQDVPPVAFTFVGVGTLVMATEISEARIPHSISFYAVVTALAVAGATSGIRAILAMSVVWAMLVSGFFVFLGVGPKGGETWVTRRRAKAGKPPLTGGGDPAWIAAAAVVLMGVGYERLGVTRSIVGVDMRVLNSELARWLSGAMTASTGLLISGLVGLLLLADGLLKPEGFAGRKVKLGPAVSLATMATIFYASREVLIPV